MKIAALAILVTFLGVSGIVSAGNPNEPDTSFTWEQHGLKVIFKDTTPLQLHIVAWYWDFGDGEYSNAQNPIHEYPGYGNYTVYFTAWNSQGFSRTVSEIIWVREGVGVEPTYPMMFWVSLLVIFGGMFIILFGRFSTAKIGGTLVILVGIMLLIVSPPKVGLAQAVHTDNGFVIYAISILLLGLVVAGIALSKNPYVRIGLALAFVTSIVVSMAV